MDENFESNFTKLVNKVDELVDIVNNMSKENKNMQNTIVESVNNMLDTYNDMIQTIDDNKKVIAYKALTKDPLYQKRDKHGDKAPAWKDIPMSDIVERYKKGESIQNIADSYGVNYITIQKRLKDQGIFVDGRKK